MNSKREPKRSQTRVCNSYSAYQLELSALKLHVPVYCVIHSAENIFTRSTHKPAQIQASMQGLGLPKSF